MAMPFNGAGGKDVIKDFLQALTSSERMRTRLNQHLDARPPLNDYKIEEAIENSDWANIIGVYLSYLLNYKGIPTSNIAYFPSHANDKVDLLDSAAEALSVFRGEFKTHFLELDHRVFAIYTLTEMIGLLQSRNVNPEGILKALESAVMLNREGANENTSDGFLRFPIEADSTAQIEVLKAQQTIAQFQNPQTNDTQDFSTHPNDYFVLYVGMAKNFAE